MQGKGNWNTAYLQVHFSSVLRLYRGHLTNRVVENVDRFASSGRLVLHHQTVEERLSCLASRFL